MEGSSGNEGKLMIKMVSVLKWDLKILKVYKSRLYFSSGGEGKERNTSHRQTAQIKVSTKYLGGSPCVEASLNA